MLPVREPGSYTEGEARPHREILQSFKQGNGMSHRRTGAGGGVEHEPMTDYSRSKTCGQRQTMGAQGLNLRVYRLMTWAIE